MKITYTVLEQTDESALVQITPESPLNGFHGVDLQITRHEDETPANFIENRVRWKVAQQVGLAIENCQIVQG